MGRKLRGAGGGTFFGAARILGQVTDNDGVFKDAPDFSRGVPDPQAAARAVPPAKPADANHQGGPYKGALISPPVTAMNKAYPVCISKLQDSCRNRGGR